jgi:hypothetical protein
MLIDKRIQPKKIIKQAITMATGKSYGIGPYRAAEKRTAKRTLGGIDIFHSQAEGIN